MPVPAAIVPVESPAILPPWIARASVLIPEGAHLPAGIALPARLERAVPSRQLQYAAGRLCARRALEALRVPDTVSDLGQTPAGAPAWPPGFVGSITHTRRFASAAVARCEDAAAVGIDTEECLDAARAERVGPGVLDDEERRLARLSPAGVGVWTTAAFSAKESLFKLLHPVVGRSFFYAAASLLAIDLAEGRFLVRLNVDLAEGYPAGLRFEGRSALLEGRVHTALWLDPGGRPGDAGW